MYTKQNIHKHQTQHFWRIRPFGIALSNGAGDIVWTKSGHTDRRTHGNMDRWTMWIQYTPVNLLGRGRGVYRKGGPVSCSVYCMHVIAHCQITDGAGKKKSPRKSPVEIALYIHIYIYIHLGFIKPSNWTFTPSLPQGNQPKFPNPLRKIPNWDDTILWQFLVKLLGNCGW